MSNPKEKTQMHKLLGEQYEEEILAAERKGYRYAVFSMTTHMENLLAKGPEWDNSMLSDTTTAYQKEFLRWIRSFSYEGSFHHREKFEEEDSK